MLSILCVRLTIKVKVGIPESFKVGWYPPQKTRSSHLKYGSKMQPRPQGAFPWLWRWGAPPAKPGDEVEKNDIKEENAPSRK